MGKYILLPLNFFQFQNRKSILFMANLEVISSTKIFFSFSLQAQDMIRADRFTVSPITEYSRRFPLVPTTPAKTNPEAIPMLHSVFILSVGKVKKIS